MNRIFESGQVRIPKEDLPEHERKCEYRNVPCPFHKECKRPEMPLNEVLEHRGSAFYDIRHMERGYDEIEWPLWKTTSPPTPLDITDFRVRMHQGAHFVLQFTSIGSNVYAWVCIIGNAEMAGKFTAKITVGQDGPTTTSHSGKVFPVDMKIEDIREHEDDGVLSFPLDKRGRKLLKQGPQQGPLDRYLRLNIRYEITEGTRSQTPASLPSLVLNSDHTWSDLAFSHDSDANNDEGVVENENDEDIVEYPRSSVSRGTGTRRRQHRRYEEEEGYLIPHRRYEDEEGYLIPGTLATPRSYDPIVTPRSPPPPLPQSGTRTRMSFRRPIPPPTNGHFRRPRAPTPPHTNNNDGIDEVDDVNQDISIRQLRELECELVNVSSWVSASQSGTRRRTSSSYSSSTPFTAASTPTSTPSCTPASTPASTPVINLTLDDSSDSD